MSNYLERSQEALLSQWETYENARRDYLTIAAAAFKGPAQPKNSQLWEQRKAQSIWGLREIPMYRSRYDVQYDYSLMPEWCLSAWPRLPWKSVKEKKPVQYHMQGVYQYPFFENLGYGSNYIWKDSAFVFQGGSSSQILQPGTDYLYTYWMARVAGLLAPDKRAAATQALPAKAQGLSVVR